MQAAEELTQEVAAPEAPEPTVTDFHEALAKSDRAAATARKAAPKATPKALVKATPKTKASKPIPKAKSAVQRVPAAEVLAAIAKLGMTQSQFARAAGVSASLMSEWVGKGRGMLAARERWSSALATAKKAPKPAAK